MGKTCSKRKTARVNVLDEVNDFKYLGSFFSAERNIEKKGSAWQHNLSTDNIWKSTTLHTKKK